MPNYPYSEDTWEYNIKIAALSDTRLLGESNLEKIKPAGEPRIVGVGFSISTSPFLHPSILLRLSHLGGWSLSQLS